MATAAVQNPPRERRPSMGAPISSLMQAPVGPGFSRPKHKRTATGFGAGDIKSVENSIPEPQREAYGSLSALCPTYSPSPPPIGVTALRKLISLQMEEICMMPVRSQLR